MKKKFLCPACGAAVPRRPLFRSKGLNVSSAVLASRPFEGRSSVLVELAGCVECGYIFNSAYDKKAVSREYGSDSYRLKRLLPGKMSANLKFVLDALSRFAVKGSDVLEIGSGRGDLAAALARRGCSVTTVDPSAEARRAVKLYPAIRHIPGFFDVSTAGKAGKFDLVIARHLIEHVTSPGCLLETAKGALKDGGVLYAELPNMAEIVRSGRYYDIFSDHYGYFTPACFKKLCAVHGLSAGRTIRMFSGQHFGMFVKRSSRPHRAAKAALPDFRLLKKRSSEFGNDGGKKATAIYGAGAHGATLWRYLGRGLQKRLKCFIDADGSKTGLFIPGTDKEIKSPDARTLAGLERIIIASALYENEINSELRARGFKGEIIKTAKRK